MYIYNCRLLLCNFIEMIWINLISFRVRVWFSVLLEINPKLVPITKILLEFLSSGIGFYIHLVFSTIGYTSDWFSAIKVKWLNQHKTKTKRDKNVF